jgi:hypothetical protein
MGRPTTFSRDVQVWGNLIGWFIPLIAVEPPHFGLVNVNVSKKHIFQAPRFYAIFA